jgi:hypothetical protein
MALTFTFVKGSEWEAGRVRGRTYDVRFDATYPTGGEPMTPDDVGFLNLLGAQWLGVQLNSGASATTTVLPVFNMFNGNLQAYETGDVVSTFLDEVANGEDISFNLYRIMFIGLA